MLTFSDIQSLANTPCRNEEIKRAFMFACYTGLRYGDLKRVSWSNIQGEQLTLTQQKTKTALNIPLHPIAVSILGERGSRDSRLFNLPASHGNMWKILREWGEEAGVQTKISAHVARHTFATMLLTYDTSIYTVKDLMGHSSMQHTQVYAKVMDSVKHRAITSLPTYQ
jgi:integrase/recombinase XerD